MIPRLPPRGFRPASQRNPQVAGEGATLLHKLRLENLQAPRFGPSEPGFVDRLKERSEIRDASLQYGQLMEGLDRIPSRALRMQAAAQVQERGDALRAFLNRASSLYRPGSLPTGPFPNSLEVAAERRRRR
jgi:hypothetical protein